MKDILSEIIAHKRIEIEQQKQAVSLSQLQEQAAAMMQETVGTGASGTTPVRSMKRALANSSSGIIAEFKRRSPSKGWIKESAQADLIPPAYEAAGASALSILTDEKFFGGTLRDSVQHARWSTSRSCVKTSSSTSISFCKPALWVPMQCCSLPPASHLMSATHSPCRHTNLGLKFCSKYTVPPNSPIYIRRRIWSASTTVIWAVSSPT